MAEVDQAFYDAHTDSAGHLDPRLVDPKTGAPRKLTKDPADAQFRREWSKVRKHLQQMKGCAPPSGGAPVGSTTSTCPPASTNPGGPPYEPGKWNDGGPVQESTNCYAYAMDSRTGHTPHNTPQPGVASGSPAATNSCADVTPAVLSDGAPAKPGDPPTILQAPQCPYQKKNKLPPPQKKGYYLVALVATSNTTEVVDKSTSPPTVKLPDYHWYRQDSDGLWSHKPGETEVRRVDSSGKPVTNPQTADRTTKQLETVSTPGGPVTVQTVLDYDQFCGYFYVKKGGAGVKGYP
jgi:hypothetical protein